MNDRVITEQYLDTHRTGILEVLAGHPRFPEGTVVSLVAFEATPGVVIGLTNQPTLAFDNRRAFFGANPGIDRQRFANVQLNKAQAVELAMTLLNAAGVDFEIDDVVEMPTDDEYRPYAF
jgi:hypothetical protein